MNAYQYSTLQKKIKPLATLFPALLVVLAMGVFSEVNARDAFEPDNSALEANQVVVNRVDCEAHTFHDASDEDWFMSYWTSEENHSVNIFKSLDTFDEWGNEITWEVYDDNGNLRGSGTGGSEERFAPGENGFYYFRLTWQGTADAIEIEPIYFFELQGTAIPMVTGFISDASTKERIAGVTVTSNHRIPITSKSKPFGLYQLPVPDGLVQLTFEKEGYERLTETIDALEDDFLRLNVELEPSNDDPLTEFVTRFYLLILERQPDPFGLNKWVADSQSGEKTGCDIARGFINSPEFKNRNVDNETYVDILYLAFFNRQADAFGKNNWLRKLESGSTRDSVLDGFLFSQEFANLAADFGIDTCST